MGLYRVIQMVEIFLAATASSSLIYQAIKIQLLPESIAVTLLSLGLLFVLLVWYYWYWSSREAVYTIYGFFVGLLGVFTGIALSF